MIDAIFAVSTAVRHVAVGRGQDVQR